MRKFQVIASGLILLTSACGKGGGEDAAPRSVDQTQPAERNTVMPTPVGVPGPKFGKGPKTAGFPAISEAIGSVKPADRASVMSEVACRTRKMDAGDILVRKPAMIREVASAIGKPKFKSACR